MFLGGELCQFAACLGQIVEFGSDDFVVFEGDPSPSPEVEVPQAQPVLRVLPHQVVTLDECREVAVDRSLRPPQFVRELGYASAFLALEILDDIEHRPHGLHRPFRFVPPMSHCGQL